MRRHMPENHPDHPTFAFAYHDVDVPFCYNMFLGVSVADGIATVTWLYCFDDGRVTTRSFTESA